jgi:hypothetical protein
MATTHRGGVLVTSADAMLQALATSATYRQDADVAPGATKTKKTTRAKGGRRSSKGSGKALATGRTEMEHSPITEALLLASKAIAHCVERPSSVRVVVPVQTVSEANRTDKWARVERTKNQRRAAFSALVRSPPVWAPVIVVLTRRSPRHLDSDNLARSLKAVRDGVADWLEIDDGDEERVVFLTQQMKSPAHGVRVEIWEWRR